ncbi:SRPBCC family protein [Gordonia sp. LSe1-13]|uniref:SRPBCC family protein n=1 Tax=Gordonia sesuvii TaxID=3116777 RepID=A0ABU7MEN5_9ACTN|nr:SRPBCC family protein [Gordonia sp. LSe1-13]
MPESSATVTLAHPADVVWEYNSTPEHIAIITPGTIEARSLSDGPLAVGSQWEGKTRLLGRTVEWHGEFTRVDAGKATEFHSTRSPFDFTIWTDLEETPDGCVFTYRIESESGLGGVFGKMADAIVNRTYQRSLSASVESLPDLIDDWVANR